MTAKFKVGDKVIIIKDESHNHLLKKCIGKTAIIKKLDKCKIFWWVRLEDNVLRHEIEGSSSMCIWRDSELLLDTPKNREIYEQTLVENEI